MPFTPLHLGPAAFFGLVLFAFIDFPTFLVANVMVDLEPFVVIFLGLDYPLHGFLHSFIGGTIVAVILAFVMSRLSNITGKVMKLFRLEQTASWRRIMMASLLGVYSHILLDTPLYPDIRPLYPFDVNPFFFSDVSTAIYVYMFCIFSFLAGIILYVVKLAVRMRNHRRNNPRRIQLFGKKKVYAEEVRKASVERLARLIKVCGFLTHTKVYLFWQNKINQ